ncbi:hypothetical protein [Nesterenkonia lutea]|uniref:DUF2238 domain-containing protein n=1 Tax=Nesterenkonia lutea TaxID=272919 RepID=A0ABR9JDH2_9MICC|nr:hypothetical protein [Nesterenkonia lutea]MBE1523542.1 hypothetical protein [Nesterenkonia lutea]
MIENFLRPPQGLAEVLADALRAFGVFSVVLAAVFFDLTDAGVLAFVLPGVFAPRFLGTRAGADITLAVTLLIAAWSNVWGLYESVPGWDLAVHFVCTGVLAAALCLLLGRIQVVPEPRSGQVATTLGIVLTTTFGLALSAVWEMVEWFGFVYVAEGINVNYTDTIADMAAGGLGALCAGLFLTFFGRFDRDRRAPKSAGRGIRLD